MFWFCNQIYDDSEFSIQFKNFMVNLNSLFQVIRLTLQLINVIFFPIAFWLLFCLHHNFTKMERDNPIYKMQNQATLLTFRSRQLNPRIYENWNGFSPPNKKRKDKTRVHFAMIGFSLSSRICCSFTSTVIRHGTAKFMGNIEILEP